MGRRKDASPSLLTEGVPRCTQVYCDQADGDQKLIQISKGRITFLPYNNTEEWIIQEDWDDNLCAAMINFTVPGKPAPPPVKLRASYLEAIGAHGPKKHLPVPMIIFTDPSLTLTEDAGTPINTWIKCPIKSVCAL